VSAESQRSSLGLLCAAFGGLSLAQALFSWLSAHGPAPLAVSASAWSRLFYGQFVALVALGYGYIAALAVRTRVFHGGPMIDFSIGLAGAMIAFGFGRGWIPGSFLLLFGLRLSTGRALLP
jgi:hypothetical protein